jgi:methylated-DNA-[protein]-cysteine S-methyltransferase
VGGACGANRIPLIIPCHRVVGSGGIGGFMHSRRGPGIEIKRWLLKHEGAISSPIADASVFDVDR